MACLQASRLLSLPSCSIKKSLEIRSSSASIPRLPKLGASVSRTTIRSRIQVQDPGFGSDAFMIAAMPLIEKKGIKKTQLGRRRIEQEEENVSKEKEQLYAILQAVMDRVEMHRNIGEQRNNWNTLMLTSINSITLSAAAMAGSMSAFGPLLALKLPSMILLYAVTAMLVVMNKIQPSQLVEEQRNAVRLFGQLRRRIETALALGEITKDTVDDSLRSLLALDRAYPLPLLGAMIEKFPRKFEPAKWWTNPRSKSRKVKISKTLGIRGAANGWDERLEREMREVVQVVRTKDSEEYERLGNIALTLNKVLAVSGPVLTGFAALATTFVGSHSSTGACWAPIVAATCASLATMVNTLEHGGQVGMVLEMYRNTAGFFSELEESIESTLAEADTQMRENGELFEMKVAMKLGRSLSELRHLARRSRSFREEGFMAADEFASKLF